MVQHVTQADLISRTRADLTVDPDSTRICIGSMQVARRKSKRSFSQEKARETRNATLTHRPQPGAPPPPAPSAPPPHPLACTPTSPCRSLHALMTCSPAPPASTATGLCSAPWPTTWRGCPAHAPPAPPATTAPGSPGGAHGTPHTHTQPADRRRAPSRRCGCPDAVARMPQVSSTSSRISGDTRRDIGIDNRRP